MILRQVGPCQIEDKGFYHAWHRLIQHMIHCLAKISVKVLKTLTSGGTYSFTRGIICIGHLSFRNTDLSGRNIFFHYLDGGYDALAVLTIES